MASAFAHAVAGAALATPFVRPGTPRRLVAFGVLGAVLPDLDVLAFRFGIPYDAMTTGGLGVAFFAPFSAERFFFPFRPILVSPISVRRFFTERGLQIVASELLWVWLPSALFAGIVFLVPRTRHRHSSP